MDKLPKLGLPIIFLVVASLILLMKTAQNIDPGEGGVLWERFNGGVVTNQHH